MAKNNTVSELSSEEIEELAKPLWACFERAIDLHHEIEFNKMLDEMCTVVMLEDFNRGKWFGEKK